jgi:hypothetical protein
VRLLWTRDRPVAETSTSRHNIHRDRHLYPGGVRIRSPSKRAVADLRRRRRGYRNCLFIMQCFTLPPLWMYIHKLQWTHSGAISGFLCVPYTTVWLLYGIYSLFVKGFCFLRNVCMYHLHDSDLNMDTGANCRNVMYIKHSLTNGSLRYLQRPKAIMSTFMRDAMISAETP